LTDLKSNLDQALQTLAGGLGQRLQTSLGLDVTFDVKADGGTLASSAAQTEDNTRAIRESDNLSLVLGNRVVDGILVFKVVNLGHSEVVPGAGRSVDRIQEGARLKGLVESSNKFVGAFRGNLFIVVSAEERAAVDEIELVQQVVDADEFVGRVLVDGGQDVEPGCEDFVSQSQSEAMIDLPMTAQRPSFSRIWSDPVPNDSSPQIERRPASMRFPKNFQPVPNQQGLIIACPSIRTSGNFEIFQTLLLSDEINGLARRHAPCQSLNAALLEVRDGISPVGNNSDRVRGRDKGILAVDHIPISVAIAGSTEGDIVRVDRLDEGVGIRQVGVRVSSAKVWKCDTVLDGRLWKTKGFHEESPGVRSSDAMKTVKEDLEIFGVRLQKVLDQREVEDFLEQNDIVFHRVDDGHFARTELRIANLGKIELKCRSSVQDRHCHMTSLCVQVGGQ